jgi:hypothetical protein
LHREKIQVTPIHHFLPQLPRSKTLHYQSILRDPVSPKKPDFFPTLRG